MPVYIYYKAVSLIQKCAKIVNDFDIVVDFFKVNLREFNLISNYQIQKRSSTSWHCALCWHHI